MLLMTPSPPASGIDPPDKCPDGAVRAPAGKAVPSNEKANGRQAVPSKAGSLSSQSQRAGF